MSTLIKCYGFKKNIQFGKSHLESRSYILFITFTFCYSAKVSLLPTTCTPLKNSLSYYTPHRVHRVAMTTFWSARVKTVQAGEGGGEGARPPPFTISTVTYKVVVYAPAEMADNTEYI